MTNLRDAGGRPIGPVGIHITARAGIHSCPCVAHEADKREKHQHRYQVQTTATAGSTLLTAADAHTHVVALPGIETVQGEGGAALGLQNRTARSRY